MVSVVIKTELKEILGTKVSQLEFKVTGLEAKVEEQQLLLSILQEKLKSINATNSVSKSIVESTAKNSMQQTCHEIRLADPILTSGMYWIDPDGQGVGDDPIYVYCDMTTGKYSLAKVQ